MPDQKKTDHNLSLTVQSQEEGWRLDRWFREHYPQWGREHLQKLLRKGQIRVDGKRVQANQRLQPGSLIKLPRHIEDRPKEGLKHQPLQKLSPKDREWLQSRLVFEDEAIVVFDKPSGLAVQGGTKTTKSLDHLLKSFYQHAGVMPRLVHRLDRDTSGLLLFAQSTQQAQKLAEQFRAREVEKAYYAIVAGYLPQQQGTIDVPLIKKRVGGQEIVQQDSEQGQSATTSYQVIKQTKDYALLQLKPLTGRTHQLRVHCLLLGTPILGDHKYARFAPEPQKSLACAHKHLLLHAKNLSFHHPITNELMTFEAPWPNYFTDFMEKESL